MAGWNTSADLALAALRERWPDWYLWTVHKAVGGTIFCAHLHSDSKTVLNAGSPDELEDQLEAWEQR